MYKIEDIKNKIILGDSNIILKNIPDKSVDLVLTDPPYNISQKKKITRYYKNGIRSDIRLDFGDWDYGWDMIPFLEESKRVLKDNGQWIIFSSEQLFGDYRKWLTDNAKYKQLLIWEKMNPIPQIYHGRYRQATELIIWAYKMETKPMAQHFNFLGQEKMKNIFRYPLCGGDERTIHPTQKPLALISDLLIRHSNQGDVVLDPFMGSGTTCVACKKLGRIFIGIEQDEKYYSIAEQRLNALPELLL